MQVKLRSALKSQNILVYMNLKHLGYENVWLPNDPKVSTITVTNKCRRNSHGKNSMGLLIELR